MQNLMPPIDTPDNLFIDGDPTLGIEGTIVTAEWLNNDQSAVRDAQQEMINVLAGADILPDLEKNNQLLTAIQALISTAVSTVKYVPDVGDLYITKNATAPGEKWPGTTWEYLGEGLTLRTAKEDLSDLGTTAGADTVTLTAENIPPHAHAIGGATGSSADVAVGVSSFDYGGKATDSQGDHVHTMQAYPAYDSGKAATGGGSYMGTFATRVGTTDLGGAHAHTTYIGPHDHAVTIPAHAHDLPAATGNAGGNAEGAASSFSTISNSIMVAVWVRTA